MPLTFTVEPGKTFTGNEKANNAKLNQLGRPIIRASGTTAPADLALADYSGVLAAGAYFYGLDIGTPNAAAVTLVPSINAYVDGLLVAFKVLNANTGAATLALNGLAAAPVKKHGDLDLQAGDWKAGQIVVCRYQLDASIVPAGASYSGAGDYVLPVVIGQTYQWVKGANDTNLVVDGITTLAATGGFTATAATVTLNGTVSGSITGTVTPASNVWQMLSLLGDPNKYFPFQPASAYLGGEQGLVPRPGVGMQGYYLRADGTWVDVLAASVAANTALNTYTEIYKAGNFI